MAFPFVFESNFETGDNSEWDSETDTASQLDIAHFSTLAKMGGSRYSPYSGAYCARIQLTGGTADAVLVEGDLNITATEQAFAKFEVYFSEDFTATADDTVILFESFATATPEAVMGFKITAATGDIQLGIGETAPTSFGAPIERGQWYTVELDMQNDPGANDGTVNIYLTKDGDPVSTSIYATEVGSLDQGAITTGSLGTSGVLATTTGTILLDGFVWDDARIYPRKRFQEESVWLTKTGQAFIGPCTVDAASITGTSTDGVMALYDTDDFGDARNMGNHTHVVYIRNVTANDQSPGFNTPVEFHRGVYAQVSGTAPQGFVSICKPSAVVMSSAGYINRGKAR